MTRLLTTLFALSLIACAESGNCADCGECGFSGGPAAEDAFSGYRVGVSEDDEIVVALYMVREGDCPSQEEGLALVVDPDTAALVFDEDVAAWEGAGWLDGESSTPGGEFDAFDTVYELSELDAEVAFALTDSQSERVQVRLGDGERLTLDCVVDGGVVCQEVSPT